MKNIKDMTQQEFTDFMNSVKAKSPNLFQFIEDFINKKVSSKEADKFIAMTPKEQRDFIDNYQARA